MLVSYAIFDLLAICENLEQLNMPSFTSTNNFKFNVQKLTYSLKQRVK